MTPVLSTLSASLASEKFVRRLFSGNKGQTLSQFYHSRLVNEILLIIGSAYKILEKLVPEVGIEPTWGGSPAGF